MVLLKLVLLMKGCVCEKDSSHQNQNDEEKVRGKMVTQSERKKIERVVCVLVGAT